MIKKIAITGGVHGNELTGAYLVKNWQKNPIKTKNVEIEYILANPKAFKECRRYIDYDLNRSFSSISLNEDSHYYEFERAKVLKEKLKNIQFLIDLHTTTANMGITIVLSKDDKISNYVAKKIKSKFDNVNILRWFSTKEGDFINSVVPHSITIEAGPICQGVLDPSIYFDCKKVVQEIVNIFENEKNYDDLDSCEVFDIVEIVDFPRIDGEIAAMLHPKFLGKDYSLVKRGDPIFVDFENRDIIYENEPKYAVFINEAAYYEKGMAFCLCEKRKI